MNREVEEHLKELTRNYSEHHAENFSALSTSENVGLNQNTISFCLNQGMKEGVLVKVKNYPVSFLHVEILAELSIFHREFEYETWEGLSVAEEANALGTMVGANGSLREAVDQIKTAVLCPGDGLPILLSGNSGSEKTFLTEKIYEYAVAEKVIPRDAPFISHNCAQYFNNPELLSSALFGHVRGVFTGAEKEHIGLIEKVDNGILFLDKIRRLSDEGQEKLFTFMDTGRTSPMGDSTVRRKANVRMIFATTESVYQTSLPTFIHRLPMIIMLPSYERRPQSERMQLIDAFFISGANILSECIDIGH